MPHIHISSKFVLAFIVSLSVPTQAEAPSTVWPHSTDVFTTEKTPIESVEQVADEHPGIAIHIHVLDTIEGLEDQLSRGLSAQPEQAKRQALERLQRLPPDSRAQLEQSAKGLALALQLGVHRYPAIVFNQQQVMYGVTDLYWALRYYQAWQTADAS